MYIYIYLYLLTKVLLDITKILTSVDHCEGSFLTQN